MLLTEIPALEDALSAHAAQLRGDWAAYRNHAYRVANLCLALSSPHPERLQKVAIAAALHDIGIWTDETFDYLPPSIEVAKTYLAQCGRTDWTAEIAAMILEHHKISRYRRHPDWLVEPFRRADWVDVSRGLVTFGAPRQLLREVFSTWPNAGFHRRLAQLSIRRLRSRPLSPLPMVRL